MVGIIIFVIVFVAFLVFQLSKIKSKALKDCNNNRSNNVFSNNFERDVYEILQTVGGKVLHNLYIPMGKDETTEIDLLYICSKCIVVFECKDYTGWIFGNENQKYWTQCFPNKEKYKFYNPILQNNTHIRNLRKYLGNSSIPIYNVVVFGDSATFRTDFPITVCHKHNVKVVMDKLIRETSYYMDYCHCEQIYEKLKLCCNVTEEIKLRHVKSVQKYHLEGDSGEQCQERVSL